MALQWREQLSVGNNIIDADHRHLIDIINRVEQCLAAKDRGALDAALVSLKDYALVHFAREEKIAEAAGYTQMPGLAQSHRGLMETLEQMRQEFDAVGGSWAAEPVAKFTGFLRGWLIDHVIKEDLLMKPALQKFAPTFDPR